MPDNMPKKTGFERLSGLDTRFNRRVFILSSLGFISAPLLNSCDEDISLPGESLNHRQKIYTYTPESTVQMLQTIESKGGTAIRLTSHSTSVLEGETAPDNIEVLGMNQPTTIQNTTAFAGVLLELNTDPDRGLAVTLFTGKKSGLSYILVNLGSNYGGFGELIGKKPIVVEKAYLIFE